MLVKVGPDCGPHRVKHEIDSLTACQFRCGHKIRISGNQYELIDLPLVGEGCNVQPDAHIDAFLTKVESEIVIADVDPFAPSVDESFERVRRQLPIHLCRRYVAETESDLA